MSLQGCSHSTWLRIRCAPGLPSFPASSCAQYRAREQRGTARPQCQASHHSRQQARMHTLQGVFLRSQMTQKGNTVSPRRARTKPFQWSRSTVIVWYLNQGKQAQCCPYGHWDSTAPLFRPQTQAVRRGVWESEEPSGGSSACSTSTH